MDKVRAKQIGDRVIELLKQLEEEFDVTVESKGGTFFPSDGTLKPKIVISEKQVGGVDRNKAQWDKYALSYNVEKDWYGKTITYKGEPWTIVGIEPSRNKYPVVIQNAAGKKLLFTSDGVRNALEVK